MNAFRHPALLILALLPVVGFAQVYSWKDASGKIHYGDRPPAEQKPDSRKLAAPPPETAGADAARKAASERQLAEREKQLKAQEEAKQLQESPAEAKQRMENCQQARTNLTAIESGQERFTSNAKGERVALDGPVRDAELARSRKTVADVCNPPKPAARPPTQK